MLTGVLLLSCPLLSPLAVAQDILISGVRITDDDTVAQIDSAIAVVGARQDLDAETRATVLKQLRDAETQLQNGFNADAVAKQFAASLGTASAETDALRTALDEQPPVPATTESLGIGNPTSLAELQQRLARETAGLTAIESQLAELRAQVEAQVSRPAAAREGLEKLQENRKQLAAIVDAPAILGEQQLLTNARNLAARFRARPRFD